jgi:hypothetical protein
MHHKRGVGSMNYTVEGGPWATQRGGMHHRRGRSVCFVGGRVCIIEGGGAYAS